MTRWRVIAVEAVSDWLEDDGPTLGRPIVDRIEASLHQNMKELRPGSSGTSQIRILFAFDAVRQAVLLTAGDKSGNWTQWYEKNIPIADARFAEHQASVTRKGGK